MTQARHVSPLLPLTGLLDALLRLAANVVKVTCFFVTNHTVNGETQHVALCVRWEVYGMASVPEKNDSLLPANRAVARLMNKHSQTATNAEIYISVKRRKAVGEGDECYGTRLIYLQSMFSVYKHYLGTDTTCMHSIQID